MASPAELAFLVSMKDQATAVMNQVGSGFTNMGARATAAATQMQQSAAAINQASQALQQASAQLAANAARHTQAGNAATTHAGSLHAFAVAARTASVAVTELVAANELAKGSLETFSQYEQRMAIVEKVTGNSKEQMQLFEGAFDSLVTKMRGGASVDFLANVAGQATQLGIRGTSDVLTFTEVLSKMANTTTTIGEQGAKDLARVLFITGEGAAGAGDFASALTVLGKSSAATEGQILHATSTIAQATSQFNLGSKSLLGLGAAAASLNFPPQLFGTSLSRTLISLRDASLNTTKGFEELVSMTGMTEGAWRDLIKNEPTEAIFKFTEVLHALNAAGKSTTPFLTEFKLQSQENVRVLGTMSERTDEFRSAVERARGSVGQLALNQENQVALETFSKQVQATTNAWDQFKIAFGGALAPGVEAGLRTLTSVLNVLTDDFKALPRWVQEAAAWFTVLVPALLGAATAALAISRAMTALRLLGLTVSFAPMLATVTGLVPALIRATVGFGGLLGAGMRLAPLAGVVGTAMSAIAGTIGPVIAAVVAAVGGVGALPIAVTAAMLAAGVEVYKHWDEIKLFLQKPITVQIKTVWDGLNASADEIQEQMRGLTGGAEQSARQKHIEELKTQLSQEQELLRQHQEALTNLRERTPMGPQTRSQAAATDDFAGIVNLEAARAAATQRRIAHEQVDDLQASIAEASAALGKMDPMSAVAKKTSLHIQQMRSELSQLLHDLPDITKPATRVQGFTTVSTGPAGRPDIDTGSQSAISKDDLAELDKMEKLIKVTREAHAEFETLKRVAQLPDSDPQHRTAGQLEALRNLIQLKVDQANPEAVILKSLEDQLNTARAITAEQKAALEVSLEKRKVYEGTGVPAAQQGLAIDDAFARLNTARTGAALGEQMRQVGAQTALAQQGTQALKQQEESHQRILNFEREHVGATKEELASFESMLAVLHQVENLNALKDKYDPVGSANKAYLDDVTTLNRALKDRNISQEYYNTLLGNMNRETLASRDPVGAQARDMLKSLRTVDSDDKKGHGEQQAMEIMNQLQEKGVHLTEAQTAAIKQYAEAVDMANKAHAGGVEGWMHEIKDFNEQVLDIQKSTVSSFSSTLSTGIVGALEGTRGSMQNFFKSFAQQMVQTLVKNSIDNIIKTVGEGVGANNNMFGLFSGLDAESNKNKAEDAAKKLQSLSTQQMAVQAGIVNITGGVDALKVANDNLNGPTGLPAGVGYDASGAALVKHFEGFREKAYPDPGNGLPRVGYGSDTITDPLTGQVTKTTMDSTVTRAQADADLARRVSIQQNKDRGMIGAEAYDRLTPGERAAITDASYNYTTLPKNIVGAAQTGNADQIAAAIRAHDNDNNGINRNRRETEAQIALGQGGQAQIITAQQQSRAAQQQMQMSQQNLAATTDQAASAVKSAGDAHEEASAKVKDLGTSAQQASNAVAGDKQTATDATLGSTGSLLNGNGSLLSAISRGTGNLFGPLGGFLGGLGGLLVGKYHSGGTVGVGPGLGMRVDPSLFRGAPRFHEGLGSDEFPAILQRQERVLTAGQARRVDEQLAAKSSGRGSIGELHLHQTVQPTGDAAQDKKAADMNARAMHDMFRVAMQEHNMNEMRPGGSLSGMRRRAA